MDQNQRDEPNNTISTAAPIPTGTDIFAQIAISGDNDYYSFSSSGNQKNVQVTLSNLPANYNIQLYDSKGNLIGTSALSGTANETVVYNNKKPNTYFVRVYGATSNDFNSTQCYTLNVFLSNSTLIANAANQSNVIGMYVGGLKLYPVPASTIVNISFDGYAKGNADVKVFNQLGQQVYSKTVGVNAGINYNIIDVSLLHPGVYTLQVNNGKEIQTRKIIISK